MKGRLLLLLSFALLATLAMLAPPVALADKLELKDGTRIEGIVKKVEKGQVTIQVGDEAKVLDILQVTSMEFDTPRLTEGTSRLPLEHFLANIEAQEMVGHIRDVENSAAEVQKLIEKTNQEWVNRKTIEPSEVSQWEAAKERLSAPLAAYQENLNDLYFHVLGKVDEYNRLMKDARSLYVGVKGVLQTGSALIPKEKEKLPLKKYVPSNWYDTIFYEGYNRGYNEAYEKYSQNFHLPYEPPASEVK